MGNKSVTMATNVLYNCWISDVMTCHKAMRTELFRSLPLRERGFAIEPEIAARVLRAGERIHEVPISYTRARPRGGQEAHGVRRAPRPPDARSLPRDVNATATGVQAARSSVGTPSSWRRTLSSARSWRGRASSA